MNLKTIILVVVLVLIGAVALDSFFIVDDRQRAIQKRFGQVVIHDGELKGFNLKIPFIDTVEYFDGRVLTLDAAAERFYSSEQKPLIVDSFVKWRILNTTKYYESTQGIEQNAIDRLRTRVDEGLRNQIGRRTMYQVVSGERDELMEELTTDLNNKVNVELGIVVIDVRVKKIDLPTEVANQVYERMESERQIEANQFRAEGEEQSLTIRADADRQKVIIEAEAYRDAEQIRGEGDAEAARIYAEAFGRNPEFYEFYRSINAYVSVFQDGNSLMVIDPSSDFFKYLKSVTGD